MTNTQSPAKRRNHALDFTKGVLVLIMVLYHWLNYFVVTEFDVYRYLRFLTPSFIFITGFLISNAYLSRYGVTSPHLAPRLRDRGLKILGLFVALNVAIGVLTGGGQASAGDILRIFTLGPVNGGSAKAASFFVLVPIAYLLLLSAALVVAARRFARVFHVVTVAFLIGILLLFMRGVESPNLELVTIGLLGVLSGYLPIEKIDGYVAYGAALVLAYVGYLAAISVWNVRYPLQVVGVFLSVAIIYRLGVPGAEPGPVRRQIIRVGKYSLFAYIAQIGVLQALHRGLRFLPAEPEFLVVSFVAAVCLTWMTVEVTDRARAKAMLVDKVYGGVFS